MLEARTFVKNFDKAKEVLVKVNAVFKGEYEIHDYIYAPKDKSKTLIDEFLRLRVVPRNIWNDKEVVVAIKNTEVKEVGKKSIIPLKKEFSTEAEAKEFVKQNLLDTFEPAFDFHRIGWQYDIGSDQVDLENIEGHLSIEFKSETEEGLRKLAEVLGVTETIKGPSVMVMKELLNK